MNLPRDVAHAAPHGVGSPSAEAPSGTVPADARDVRRRELAQAECLRRGVRFLPAQALRAIYEKEGLL